MCRISLETRRWRTLVSWVFQHERCTCRVYFVFIHLVGWEGLLLRPGGLGLHTLYSTINSTEMPTSSSVHAAYVHLPPVE